MAVSISIGDKAVLGNKRVTFSTVTFDSSYPTGGEPLTAADLGLSTVEYAVCNVNTVGGTQNVANVWYDKANSKIKVYDETPGEASNTSDLSTLLVDVIAFGK